MTVPSRDQQHEDAPRRTHQASTEAARGFLAVPARCGPHGTMTSPTLMLIERQRAEGRPWRMVVAWRRTSTLRPNGTDACTVAAPTSSPSHESLVYINPSFRRLHSYSGDVAGTPHGPTSTVGRTSIYNSLMGGAWSTQSPAIAWKQACSGEHSATGSHMPVAPVDTSGTSCCLLSRVALMMVRHNNHMMH